MAWQPHSTEQGRPLWRAVWTAAFVALTCMAAPAGSPVPGAASASEERVRAAFLFQVAQYVHWPQDAFAGAHAPLRLCVLSRDMLLPVLEETLRGKTIDGHPIAVTRAVHAGELASCHVGFIGLTREKQMREILAKWTYPPVMLVGEMRDFAEMGGTVNLVLEGGKVSFEINTVSAGRSRLEFRSQLLRFARIVGDRLGGGR